MNISGFCYSKVKLKISQMFVQATQKFFFICGKIKVNKHVDKAKQLYYILKINVLSPTRKCWEVSPSPLTCRVLGLTGDSEWDEGAGAQPGGSKCHRPLRRLEAPARFGWFPHAVTCSPRWPVVSPSPCSRHRASYPQQYLWVLHSTRLYASASHRGSPVQDCPAPCKFQLISQQRGPLVTLLWSFTPL